ncbi:hypothetical protein F4803DRAFT_570920 [Xylaria telfairii]|nr:hypothetical protein F4803DRAFT_570920 [Xylaria telfairii]
MTELVSLADLPALPSSMDPLFTGPSAPLALPAAGIRAILRRAKSMSYHGNPQDFRTSVIVDREDGHGEYTRGRTMSPVRANSKRRSEVSRGSASPPTSPSSVETGSGDYRSLPSRVVPPPRTQPRATSSQRSPSRGRTRRRDATPYCNHLRRKNSRRHNKRSNVSRPRQHMHDQGPPLGQVELPSSSNADGHVKDVSSYITKGPFRLYDYQSPKLFRFPKLRNQLDRSWRVGDGFSGDEATPDFTPLMTCKHKRKQSRSLPAFDQLSVEADYVGNDTGAVTSSQSHIKRLHRPRGKVCATEVRELWPTRENFADSTITQNPTDATVENHSPILPLRLKPVAKSKLETRRAIPLKRMASGFEGLGKSKRRSQSHHSGNQSFSFRRILPEQKYQTIYGEYNEEGNGPCKGLGDESDEESVVFEYTYSASEFECTDSGSERLCEGNLDDLDEDMQDIVLDSQLEEVPSSSSGLG